MTEAMRMLELFGSIGATHFDLTHIHLCGEKRGYRRNRSITEVTRSMLHLLASAERRQNNSIVRPRVTVAGCIQLDDLDKQKAKKIAWGVGRGRLCRTVVKLPRGAPRATPVSQREGRSHRIGKASRRTRRTKPGQKPKGILCGSYALPHRPESLCSAEPIISAFQSRVAILFQTDP